MRSETILRAVVACAAALWVSVARADPPSSAEHLYQRGAFVDAAAVAEADPTPDGQAMAARALLAACFTAGDGPHLDVLLDRAERAARNALDLDRSAVEPRLQLALIYGIRGRRASLAEAFRRNYAPRGREMIEEALAIEPDNARALALLGAWHLEVLRRARAMGRMAYGARFEDGVQAFERARALAPHDPVIALRYAMALILLDPSGQAQHAAELLRLTAAMKPVDALEAHAQRSAEQLARTLVREGPSAAADAVLATGP